MATSSDESFLKRKKYLLAWRTFRFRKVPKITEILLPKLAHIKSPDDFWTRFLACTNVS